MFGHFLTLCMKELIKNRTTLIEAVLVSLLLTSNISMIKFIALLFLVITLITLIDNVLVSESKILRAFYWHMCLFIGSVESTISFTVQSVTCVYQLSSRIRIKLVRNPLVCSVEYRPINNKCSYHTKTSQSTSFYMMETLHDMHVKHFRKKNLLGRFRKLWFWRRVNFSRGSENFLGKWKKIRNHSIRNNYCNMF